MFMLLILECSIGTLTIRAKVPAHMYSASIVNHRLMEGFMSNGCSTDSVYITASQRELRAITSYVVNYRNGRNLLGRAAAIAAAVSGKAFLFFKITLPHEAMIHS